MSPKFLKQNDSDGLQEILAAGMQFVLGVAVPISMRAYEL
jgi:hypothetical protein